jgi:hypothetical protein
MVHVEVAQHATCLTSQGSEHQATVRDDRQGIQEGGALQVITMFAIEDMEGAQVSTADREKRRVPVRRFGRSETRALPGGLIAPGTP